MKKYNRTNQTKTIVDSIKELLLECWVFILIDVKRLSGWLITNALFSMVIPLGIIFMISLMSIDMTKEVAVVYISGNIITSISNLCITSLAQSLIGKRMQNGFEHFATLPINRLSPLVGTFVSSAVGTIPSLIIMPIIGMLIFNVTISVSGWLIIIIIISVIIMTGIGAIIGTCIDDYNKANTIAMIVMFFVMFGTPVYYSLDALPFGLRIFQKLLPFSYSLEAMRSLMLKPVINNTIIIDFMALCLFMIISLALTLKFFVWKQRN
jgi:ABC-type multidrug transport system permease subunit